MSPSPAGRPVPEESKTPPLAQASAIISPALGETLLHISNELLTTYDTDQLLDRILELLRQLVEYETAAIHLVDGDRLFTRAGVGAAALTVGQFNFSRDSDFVWQFLEREKRPYVTGDLRTERWRPLAGFEWIRSFMAVPLTIHDELIGILTVDHSEPDHFSGQQVEVVTLFASQAAVALARANLLESERRQRRFAESQLAFSYRLMQTTTTDMAIDALLATIAENAPYDAGSVTLLTTEEPHQGYIAAVYGYTNPDEAYHQPVDMRQFQLLIELADEHKPIYLPEVRGEARWRAGNYPDAQEVRSILLAPLLYSPQSELIGYITLKSYRPNAFSETDVNNILLLCNQTAATLRTLRLLEETRRRLNEVSVLAEMSAHLNRTYDLAETLRFVLDRVVSVISQGENVPDLRAAIILRQPASNILHLAVGHNLAPEEIERFNNRPYTIHEGTFARSIGQGEWVEIKHAEEISQLIAEQFIWMAPRQLLNIPLTVDSETIGIISVDYVVRDPTTRQLLRAIADLAGSAIQKTQTLAHSRQRAVELVETYERLQVMDQQRDEFIQNITHDLKAPLTFIRGYAELMAEGGLGEITPEQSEALEVIQERTDAINQLIADILRLKEVEAHPLQEIPFNLDELARKSVRNARIAARLAGLEIRVSTQEKNVPVKGDIARMEQVFENLLSNAIKYSPNAGEISVVVETRMDRAQVSVVDQGIGIPPEEIENIWNRYYRIAGISAEGSGLGLANVRRIIEAHGGRIWVQSSGQGSTFTFELPLYGGD
ncbi:MAG: GAF domain-containing protein [Chloroflexi bacterium]|nr:GAF domain-containing protein [Chloroflexota bacterium]